MTRAPTSREARDAAGSPAAPRADLIIEGAYVVTLDDRRPVIVDGSVAVIGDRIAAAGSANEVGAAYPRAGARIDASGCLVMPGLIDGHTHLFQVLGRGLGDGLELMAWLRDFMLPMAVHMTTADVVAAVRLSSLMSVLAGTTAVVDNHYAPTDTATTLAVAESVESVGLRGAIARGIFGSRVEGSDRMGVPDELHAYTASEELAITEGCLGERPSGSRVEIWPMPENVVYVDRDLNRGLRPPGRRARPALAGALQRGPGGDRHLRRRVRRAAGRVAEPGRAARASGHPGPRHLAQRRRGGRHGRGRRLRLAPAGVQPGHLIGRHAAGGSWSTRAPQWGWAPTAWP